ncbi:MAG TPA: hypothetical protein EYP98_20155 [Planctomycetes bacterium]|nr:hypothetical protein [Planctomycetota bacterium]
MARILLSVSFLLGTAVAQAATTEPPVPSFAFLSTPPIGLPVMPMPAAYKPTEAMFDLGKKLFHDGILSKDRSVTCASCHMAKNGFAHPDALPPGVDGQRALRHAPSLFNRGYGTLQRWDGSSPSLEAFVLEPISDPREMGLRLNDAIDRAIGNKPKGHDFVIDRRNAAPAVLPKGVRGCVLGEAQPRSAEPVTRDVCARHRQRHGTVRQILAR